MAEPPQISSQIWAQPNAFPAKPLPVQGREFGFFDAKGRKFEAANVEDLASKIKTCRRGVDLVWSPDSEYLQVPEALAGLHPALRHRRRRSADQDIADGLKMSLFFGAILAWTLYSAWVNGGQRIESLYSGQLSGLASLLFFIFGLLPLYEGWKTRRHLRQMSNRGMDEDLRDAQFDCWMHRHRVPFTYAILVCLMVCGLAQLYTDWTSESIEGMRQSILRAGLLKHEGLRFLADYPDATQRWRILTTPMLHGNVVHWAMNVAALLYLGRRVESLTRWPHLLIVLYISMWVGGYTSFHVYPDRPAVGISGGVMGLLGFLLVFEQLNAELVPKLARRRLLAGLLLMAVMGWLGMSFIDNAAHLGGLIAGMAYAAIVFPSSSSPHRPKMMGKDRVLGAVAGIGILLSTLTAFYQMLF